MHRASLEGIAIGVSDLAATQEMIWVLGLEAHLVWQFAYTVKEINGQWKVMR